MLRLKGIQLWSRSVLVFALSGSVTAGFALAQGLRDSASLAHKDKTFTELFRQTNSWAAGDGGISIPLSDGRVLWLFGDSYVDQFDPATGTVPCLFSARNAVLLQDSVRSRHLELLRNPSPKEKSFFRPPEVAPGKPWPCFWPGAGFQSGDTIYIYQMEMDQTPGGGALAFKTIGHFWAKLSFPQLRITGYKRLPDMNGISFWCGYIPDEKTGITYAFGDKGNGIGSDVYVARFPTKNPEGAWSFWDGQGWNLNAKNARVIAKGASFSVGISKVNDHYLLTTSEFSVACDQGTNIYIATAKSVTGPFSARKKIFTVDDTVNGHHPFFYTVFSHPEFIDASGELLVTYSINGYEPCVPNCVNGRFNPDYYRPRAVRISLKDMQP